ncbi:SRPBCC family protein [Ferroplasma sp.]|uniref:SRPBCC family protein n=1 Tax=Ferroplasma sp. TaxID=2591003 RepID=UPI00307ECA41
MEFQKEIEVNSSKDAVWDLIIDYKKIPEYWHGTRSIEKDGDYYMVQFAFPGKGKMELETDDKNFTITEKYIKGPFTGEKITRLEGQSPLKIISIWNIKLSPLLRAFSKKLQGHFEQGTEDALKRIKDHFES